MVIKTYNPEVQKFLHSKTEPQPWLHAAIVNDFRNNKDYKDGDETVTKTPMHWAIYIWDTREVIETGEMLNVSAFLHRVKVPGRNAVDNYKQLNGNVNQAIKNEFRR